jgi:hypothetical protein
VQILDTIDATAAALKHRTTADVARQLLAMYSTDNATHNRRMQRTRRSRAAACITLI